MLMHSAPMVAAFQARKVTIWAISNHVNKSARPRHRLSVLGEAAVNPTRSEHLGIILLNHHTHLAFAFKCDLPS